MKTIFLMVAALLLTGSSLRACFIESYPMALVQYAAEAKVIAALNVADIPEEFSTDPGDASIWMNAPMEFLKGSRADTIFSNTKLKEKINRAKLNGSGRIYIMLIPKIEKNREYAIHNKTELVFEPYVTAFDARLRELIRLTDQRDEAGLWQWEVRGLLNDNQNPPIWQDAMITLEYSLRRRNEDSQTTLRGLNIATFPEPLKPELSTYIARKLQEKHGKDLRGVSLLLEGASRVGATGLAGPCLAYCRSVLDGMEALNQQGVIQQDLDQVDEFDEFTDFKIYTVNGDYMSVFYDGISAAQHAASFKDATPAEVREACRSILLGLRMYTEYTEPFSQIPAPRFRNFYAYLSRLQRAGTGTLPSGNYLLSLLSEKASPPPSVRISTNQKISAALKAFALEAAPILDMCADPYVTALTGDRNWWGCHQAETALTTFVLDNTTSLTAPAIAIAPNPVTGGHCTVEWKADSDVPRVRLALMDASGREAWSQQHPMVRYAPVQQAVIDLPADLAAGAYTLMVQYPDRQLEVKVVVE